MSSRTALPAVRSISLTAACVLATSVANAAERFVQVHWSDVRFEGEGPTQPIRSFLVGEAISGAAVAEPYVVLDAPGEVSLHEDSNSWFFTGAEVGFFTVRIDEGVAIRGRLFVPDQDTGAIRAFRFEVPSPSVTPDARRVFYEDKAVHYDRMLTGNLPGAAWFRHQRDEARRASTTPASDAATRANGRQPADLLDLFSGSRAIAENLDLDRSLRLPTSSEATVELASISGVTTRAMDWVALAKGKTPELDALARYVPADQHAVFFPTFEAMVKALDEVDAQGTQLLEFFDASVQDHGIKERYQHQMCLPFSTLGRLLGPTVVSSIAMTGSDPFLVGGSDIVVAFECKQPVILEGFLASRQAEAVKNGAERVDGVVLGARYAGVVSRDRRVSSYLTRFDSTVVVTNSFQALARVARTAQDSTLSILSADEYVWFRDRYRRGEGQESALLVLTDAAIRRWAGPRSRIGDARRLRAAAAMAEIQARHVDDLAAGRLAEGSSAADADFPVSADFVWTKHGVHSPTWGNLDFLTPISEQTLDRVSPEEKAAYEEFRGTFQRRWRVFDPIAIRFSVVDGKIEADATIQPLTLDSEYQQLKEWTSGAALSPTAGDPHEGTLFHIVTALSKTNELGRMLRDISGPTPNSFGPDPLAWLGSSLALYAERDAWWDRVREARSWSEAEDVEWYSIPLVLRLEVKDPLKLALFLTAARAYADQSAPNLTVWENRTWQERGYVRVAPTEGVFDAGPGQDAALYYVPFPDALVLSFREDLIHKAIDRHRSGKADPTAQSALPTWLGGSASVRLDRDAVDLLNGFVDSREQAAWSALPILDEWKRRFPNEDPVAVHERLWGVRLTPPGGGRFVWNDELQAMESSDYGRPGSRKRTLAPPRAMSGISTAELGITFEGEGLRARAALTKKR